MRATNIDNSSTGALLVVEDSDHDRRAIEWCWERMNRPESLHFVTNGEECLEWLERRNGFNNRPMGDPFLVLLDLDLPGMRGADVFRQIRRNSALDNIPVVIFSSFSEPRDRLDSAALDLRSVFRKPDDLSEMLRLLTTIVEYWKSIERAPGRVRAT